MPVHVSFSRVGRLQPREGNSLCSQLSVRSFSGSRAPKVMLEGVGDLGVRDSLRQLRATRKVGGLGECHVALMSWCMDVEHSFFSPLCQDVMRILQRLPAEALVRPCGEAGQWHKC